MRFFTTTFALCFILATVGGLAQTWTPVSSPIYGGQLDEIVVDDEGTLFGNIGLFVVKSTDKGLTWTSISPKKPLGLEDMNVDARLAFLRGPFNVKVAALYPTTGDFTEIYTTFDGGNTWSTSQVPVQFQGAELFVAGLSNGKGLAFARSTNSTVVLSTNDGGQSWAFEAGFDEMPSSIHESPVGITYVVDNGLLIRRRDAEGAWSTIPLPEGGTPIQNICTAGSRLYLVSLDSVYSTTNEGSTWVSTTFDSPVATFYPRQIVGFPDGGAVLFSQFENNLTAVYRLKNDSLVWSTRHDSLPTGVRRPISFGENNIIFPDDAGPLFSDTWGSEWTMRTQGILLLPIWRFAIQGTSIIAVSFDGSIYRGQVGGSSWDIIPDRPLASGDFPLRDIVDVAPSTYLINSNRGMFRSENDGNSWGIVAGTENDVYQLNLCKRRNGNIAVTTRNAVKLSTDLGLTWAPIVTVDDTIRLSGIAETADGTLYVASEQGLYRVDGPTLTSVHQLNVPVGFAVAAASNAQVFGVVGGSENEGRLEFAVTLDGGNTWTSRTFDIPNGLEPPILDAVLTNTGHLFVSYPLGLIHMTPMGTITSEPMTLQSFSVGLELDAEENLLRSGISIIEKNDQPVSVQEQTTVISTSVYPTPGRDVVRIAGISTTLPISIRIVNALGVSVAEQISTADNGVVALDVRSLPSGTYTAIIGTTGQSASLVISN